MSGAADDRPGADRLMSLAGEILDGVPVDWTAAADAAGTLSENLRVLEQLAHVTRDEAPREWGSLRVIERVGAGAHGEVFRAWDPALDREVALKILYQAPASSTPGPAALEEGRLLARIRHPNVVTVFGADQIGGRVGLWTEFVRGDTLQSLVQRAGPLPADAVVAIGLDLCAALDAVHAAGVVHGDVKAQNVLREKSGRVVLVDLGTGREHVSDETGPTFGGTPLYMAPELWRQEPVTPQSDIYSLGVLLSFLVSGTHPVRGATAAEVRDAHLAGRRHSLGEARPGLSRAFVRVVERAMDPEPDDLWEIPIDDATGLPAGAAVKLWESPHQVMLQTQATHDGAGLVFLGQEVRRDLYLATWNPEARTLTAVRKLTVEPASIADLDLYADAWTPAGDAVLFNTSAHDSRVYRRAIDTDEAQLVLQRPQTDLKQGHFSPDGASLFYVGWEQATLMRQTRDGRGEPLFDADGTLWIRCAITPARVCGLGSLNSKGLTVTRFDAGSGKPGRSVQLPGTNVQTWDLSPDGSQAVGVHSTAATFRLSIADLNSGHVTIVGPISGGTATGVAWSPDGQGWFVTRSAGRTSDVLFIDRAGTSHVLWHSGFQTLSTPLVSPDGKRILFSSFATRSTVYSLRGF